MRNRFTDTDRAALAEIAIGVALLAVAFVLIILGFAFGGSL